MRPLPVRQAVKIAMRFINQRGGPKEMPNTVEWNNLTEYLRIIDQHASAPEEWQELARLIDLACIADGVAPLCAEAT